MEVTQAEQSAIAAVMPPAERAALALNSLQTERDLRDLVFKFSSIQSINDKAGREQAHRVAIKIKDSLDDIAKFIHALITEADRLFAIIEPEEQRLLTLRDAWDTEQEEIGFDATEGRRGKILKKLYLATKYSRMKRKAI